MLNTGEWSVSDLIKYLVRLSPPLTAQWMSILKSSKLFAREYSQNNVGNGPRYCANELYPPVEIFRQLQLPVIDWDKKSKWMNESDEGKDNTLLLCLLGILARCLAVLLYRLGLHPHPPLKTIIELCASPNISVGKTAFTYFCENLRSTYPEYNPEDFQDDVFIPAENNEGTCLKSPGDVW